MSDAIVAEDLVKTYGKVRALDGAEPARARRHRARSARAQRRRQDHGGAHPDHPGRARLGPRDRRGSRRRPRSRGSCKRVIGLSGQYAAVDEHLTGFENLDMVGRLYHLGRAGSRERADELLERFDLVDAADRPVKGYSGGMRRRLDLAARAGRRAAGAVPRRADHRARPAQPHRPVGRHRRAGARRHDAAADHAISRGGRPARRRHRRHRPRPRDRRGHLRRAEEPGRRRATRGRAR